MIILICKCGKSYKAKKSDISRGWAKSCSKKCAAIKREKENPRNLEAGRKKQNKKPLISEKTKEQVKK